MTPERAATIDWFRARLARASGATTEPEGLLAPTWRSSELARYAFATSLMIAPACTLESVTELAPEEARCAFRDERGRTYELLLSFDSGTSGRVTRLCMRPVLAPGIEVRPPAREDAAEMRRLELAACVRRDDGTAVVIDHAERQFEHHRVLRDHRWLAAFEGARMVAVQGVAIAEAPIAGTTYRIAYNHYSRSDPAVRGGGNQLHLIATLYRDIYPAIDQFMSLVDVRNPTGLRLSFGQPWPVRVRRLFISVAALTATPRPRPTPRTFDPAHAAALLNATHVGLDLWVPRTAEFLSERVRRAPTVYGPDCWRLADHAALAVWASGERRTYRTDGGETTRTLALVLDYGFDGACGREELTGLLARTAEELAPRGITHLALFAPERDERTRWLEDLAEAADTYAACAPGLVCPPAPTGAFYVDHLLF